MGIVVKEVKEGQDGNVRTATVRYTNPGGNSHSRSPPKLAVRPIHKLAVIVPVDYRFKEDWWEQDTRMLRSRWSLLWDGNLGKKGRGVLIWKERARWVGPRERLPRRPQKP